MIFYFRAKEPLIADSQPPLPSATNKPDTIIKHIEFANEKRDIGLQLSHGDLPSSSKNEKSAQTRWTSTKPHPEEPPHSKGRYLRTIDDPLLDDPSMNAYQPPALYFNSHSDFLQMMTPTANQLVDEAKENRLAYLASIPIETYEDDGDFDPKQHRKSKPNQNVRFKIPPSSSIHISKPSILAKQTKLPADFLNQFPLLRSLVEEALALQQMPGDPAMPLAQYVFSTRPITTDQKDVRKSKPSPPRTQSVGFIRSVRPKSVIHTRGANSKASRLYPPPTDTRQMVVTQAEVRHLVDRLSKPRFNKRTEREIAAAKQIIDVAEPIVTPRLPPKSVPGIRPTTKKPPPSYGTTRAHRLYAEFARARRVAQENPPPKSPRSQRSPRKESPPNQRQPPSSPQLLNTGTLSHFSLLNKVDIDSATIERNSIPQGSGELPLENLTSNMKTSSTTSQDVTLELNRPSSSASSSSSSSSVTPKPTLPDNHPIHDMRDDPENSMTNVTD